jgi:hypothetical protein
MARFQLWKFLIPFLFLLNSERVASTITLDSCAGHNAESWYNQVIQELATYLFAEHLCRIDDALWLATRASANLNEALQIANGDVNRLPSQALTILRAFLGPQVTFADLTTVACRNALANSCLHPKQPDSQWQMLCSRYQPPTAAVLTSE